MHIAILIGDLSIWLAGPRCSSTLGQRLLLILTSRYRSPLRGWFLEDSWVLDSLGSSNRAALIIAFRSLLNRGQTTNKYLSILRGFDIKTILIKSNKIIFVPIFFVAHALKISIAYKNGRLA
ncbi:hypothetical protein ACJJIR_15990 [Microbulbifer sp. SSSA008]|uniref:hypothetical protein n=1 Tax=Microbulbifer sp. SSSA008 TaxID=3243380 RepID=UPI00403989EF